MDNLFPLQHGQPWPLLEFCQHLRRTRPHSLAYGITSVRHFKRLYEDFQHESLVLDVVPLIPGPNNPQLDNRTYIELGRFKVQGQGSRWNLGIGGSASDRVVVLTQRSVQDLSGPGTTLLRRLSWTTQLPRLYDVLKAAALLSLAFPGYNIFTRQCFWLARAVYSILHEAYTPFQGEMGNLAWKRGKFMVICRLLTPSPPPVLILLCRRNREWDGDTVATD